MTHHTRRTFLASSLAAAATTALTAHALPVAPTSRNETDFLEAVVAGRLGRVESLLAENPDLANAHDTAGRSALVLACRESHDEVVDALLKRNPSIGLVEAAMIPQWERAEELARADPAAANAWHPVGGTVLYAAMRAGNDSVYRLQDLGAHADANPHGARGVTPAYGALEVEHEGDAYRCLTALISNGAHVNAPQRGGDSLLHVAARRGDPKLVRYLIRRGADIQALDRRGRSARQLAANETVAELLENHGRVARDDMTTRYAFDASGGDVTWPDLSDVSRDAQTAVTGPSHFDITATREAMNGEARMSFSRSTQNELAVEACGHTGRSEITRMHLGNGAPQSLCTSLSVGDLTRARTILEAYPGAIHERGPHDFAPMFYPVIGRMRMEAAALLLDAGADIEQDSMGTTGLHWAAFADDRELADFLLERGANINAVGYKWDRAGQTPKQLAQMRGRDRMVAFLDERGAD